MAEQVTIRELDDAGRRGVNMAAALAREQLRYARAIALEGAKPDEAADPVLLAALLGAIASNYAAVK